MAGGAAIAHHAALGHPTPFARAALPLRPSHSGLSGPFPVASHAWTLWTWTESETITLKYQQATLTVGKSPQ